MKGSETSSSSVETFGVKNWFVLYTKPRLEDFVTERLKRIELEVLNPKLKRRKTIRGRLQEVIEPLFPCYIFANLDIDLHYRLVKYTRGVKRFVGNEGSPAPVGNEIIDAIKSRIKEGYVTIQPPSFKPGEEVLIKEGPFKDFIGIFERDMKAKDRVIILLNAVSYQARVTIEKEFLVRVKD
ncbi:MAG: transcription termination/antitermination NusG family protein [Nitrospirota bacterium]